MALRSSLTFGTELFPAGLEFLVLVVRVFFCAEEPFPEVLRVVVPVFRLVVLVWVPLPVLLPEFVLFDLLPEDLPEEEPLFAEELFPEEVLFPAEEVLFCPPFVPEADCPFFAEDVLLLVDEPFLA